MKNKLTAMLPIYIAVLSLFLIAAKGGSKAVTVLSENIPLQGRQCVVVDAGHGGEDGGAVSCTGIPESNINLEISLRLTDLLNLLGVKTYMIRTTDCSVYTEGNTIAARKISDLKERVRVVNEIQPALLLSIHQNYFGDSRYSGPQVFYGKSDPSKKLADFMQSVLTSSLAPQNKRDEKNANGIYLMEHVNCTALLIECGFLSNSQEEQRLNNPEYQKKLCAVIASVTAQHLSLD